jgi:hypothetical protein
MLLGVRQKLTPDELPGAQRLTSTLIMKTVVEDGLLQPR